MKIKLASGFTEEVFQIEPAFFETPLGHGVLYDEVRSDSYEFRTRNFLFQDFNFSPAIFLSSCFCGVVFNRIFGTVAFRDQPFITYSF